MKYQIRISADTPNRLYVTDTETSAEVMVDMDNVVNQETRVTESVKKAITKLEIQSNLLKQIRQEFEEFLKNKDDNQVS